MSEFDIPIEGTVELTDAARLMHAVLLSAPRFVDYMTNLVGNDSVVDIYGPPGLPDNWEIRKGLFFLDTGGPGNIYLPIGQESFDFYAYGEDIAEARAIFLRLRYLLHRRGMIRMELDGKYYIYQYSRLMSGPQDRTDPEEGWNLVYSSFLVDFVETDVPDVT